MVPEENPRTDDDTTPASGKVWEEDMADPEITLSELVAGIIDASTSPRGNHFNPPPEARFMSNRNVSIEDDGPMASVALGETTVGPFDVDLDSTSEAGGLSPIPFTFVSRYIRAIHHMCLIEVSVILSKIFAMSIQQ